MYVESEFLPEISIFQYFLGFLELEIPMIRLYWGILFYTEICHLVKSVFRAPVPVY